MPARSSVSQFQTGPVASLQRPGNEFDVITLFYVIEHLVDPADMLQSVFHLLKPGGLVLLRWPHTTPIVRLLGPFARKLDLYHTPYHLSTFPRDHENAAESMRFLRHPNHHGRLHAAGQSVFPYCQCMLWKARRLP